jgi:hypothetical protein
LGLPAFLVGVTAEKAVRFFAAICHCQKRCNAICIYEFAMSGFSLQPLTQIPSSNFTKDFL